VNSRRPPLSPDAEAIEAMAAAWLAQRDDGLTGEEQVEFDRWQRADPRHAAAVARLEKTWATLQQLREFRPQSKVHPDRDVLLRPAGAARIISFPAAVAGLAAAFAIGGLLWLNRPVEAAIVPPMPVYATTADGYQRVTLEDGSVLELNADSLVRVHYSPETRRVQLVRGEAHFTVAKNPRRPFIVHAGAVAVRAVGTAFNVRLGESNVEVLVTEGRVKVRSQGGPAAASPEIPELGVGDRLLVSTAAPGDRAPAALPPTVEALDPEVVQESLAWQGPRLRFVDTPLASVVAQFNRRNQLQLELGEAGLVGVPVDGSFRAENVEAFVRLLESNGAIKAERPDPNRIVLRRAHAPAATAK
jgi:transmembrane sensor